MIEALSRGLMQLATCCLGESRREWALAMQAEFEEADRARTPLSFACGCLIAAWRELPRHTEGRLGLASHVLALGILIPLALFQFGCGLGLSTAHGGLHPLLIPDESQGPYVASPQLAAMPALHILWLMLGAGHLRLAWVLLERDWSRVVKAGALIAAAAVTLFMFMGVLLLDTGALMVLAAELAIETIFIFALARSHERIFPNTTTATTGW
jgi:hypothetical protein